MGLFSKLFGKQDQSAQSSALEQRLPSYKTVQDLMDRYAGIAFDKQLTFMDIIGTNNWDVDMTEGTISFGPQLVFPLQVLGTFSHVSRSWLWAWANEKSGLSEKVVQQSYVLKRYGENNGIGLFANSSFDFSKEDMHIIGLIASGMLEASAYYIADYGQGAMLVTLKSESLNKLNSDNHQHILNVFPQLISRYDMHHKIALTHYLNFKGYTVAELENSITGTKKDHTITGLFDDKGRLASLNG